MHFLENNETPLHFASFQAKRDKEGDKTLIMRFYVELTDDNIDLVPEFIQRQYRAVKDSANCVDKVPFNRAIGPFNVNLSSLPKQEGTQIRIAAVKLNDLALERVTSNSESTVNLHFAITVAQDRENGPWGLESFGTDLWATFEEAQEEIPFEEGKDEGEGEPEDEMEAESRSEEPRTPRKSKKNKITRVKPNIKKKKAKGRR
jgi:hypothetical protein